MDRWDDFLEEREEQTFENNMPCYRCLDSIPGNTEPALCMGCDAFLDGRSSIDPRKVMEEAIEKGMKKCRDQAASQSNSTGK